ncbi:MAG: hypothetical protein HYV46_04760 [candidate division NC10 bacterium]|nr:hypothetical protein [candidate division NC10 bacterium]
MRQEAASVYLLAGAASYKPPPLWEEASAGGSKSLQEYWESGKLGPLYAESLLWTGFERLVTEAISGDVDLSRTTSINVAISYPHELAQTTEAQVAEDFGRRLAGSPHRRLFRRPPRIRCTPTHAASASGIVPFNDALADLIERGEEMSLVVTAGNTKGTNRNRPRIAPAEITEIFASLVSPFDRRATGANMLKLGAAALGRVFQHDFAMVKALDTFVYEQRLFTHELARRDLSTAHVTTHPDEIEDRTIYSPVKLIGIAPQSLGYAGLVLSRQPPTAEHAVRVAGIGCAVDPSSIRDRRTHIFSQAMEQSVSMAMSQARIPGLSSLKILEHHNPFPGVPLTELEVVLRSLGYPGSVSHALLANDVGVNGRLIKAGRSGGAMAGHGITPTFVRLVYEAAKQLWGVGGYSPLGLTPEAVAYAGISSVGGHHTFDGYVILAGGRTEEVSKIQEALKPFDHDSTNAAVGRDLEEQAALTGVEVPDGMTVAFISHQETKRGRDYFGIARTPDGRDFPFVGPPGFFERLLTSAYIGTPVRLSPTLQALES